MSSKTNTSYRVHVQSETESRLPDLNTEQGAMMVTDEALYMGFNDEKVIVYPPQSDAMGLGWARYDDTEWTSLNKKSLADGVTIALPNNAGNVINEHIHSPKAFYNSATQKIQAVNNADVYVLTVVFKYSSANANQTYLELKLEAINGTPYDRLSSDITFPKGNDVEHNYHGVFQYYSDSDFVSNGSQIQITAIGGTAKVWDIIYFIQRTQNHTS